MMSPESSDDPPDEQRETPAHQFSEQPNNPLHGVKLVDMLEYLVEEFGWQELGGRININCFNSEPSIKSSLKFLRTTPWARDKVERLYLRSILRQREGSRPSSLEILPWQSWNGSGW